MADELKMEMDWYVGPGGTKCPCCNRYFGKCRKELVQLARARLKVKNQKRIKEGIEAFANRDE